MYIKPAIMKLMHKKNNSENGFITMIVMMIAILVFVIGLAYMRVKNNGG
jgi:Tfp pilus assembly protein PilX